MDRREKSTTSFVASQVLSTAVLLFAALGMILGFVPLAASAAAADTQAVHSTNSAATGSATPAGPIGHTIPLSERPSVTLAPSDTTPHTITFSEFPVGTQITNQYVGQGVTFNSGAFIDNDASNPTAPILSGTPEYNGPITVTFVAPGNAAVRATATNVTFDAGYFNELNSTEITWFDINGNALGTIANTSLAIQTISLPGAIGGFTIQIVGNEPAGYGIDNLSFSTGTSQVSLLDGNIAYTNGVDLSDSNMASISPASANPLLANDNQVVTAAVADGATKVLLKYTGDTAGFVDFTQTTAATTDDLREIDVESPPSHVATQLVNGKNVAFAVYTVPNTLPNGASMPINFSVTFTPIGGSPGSPITASLTLQEPPVLLVHGTWSKPTNWEQTPGGVRYTTGIYVALTTAQNPFDVWLVDYTSSSTASLAANQLTLLNAPGGTDSLGGKLGGIMVVLKKYRSQGIAITKVDAIGHSYGGLVIREFYLWPGYKSVRNFGQGYIRRYIAVGSPHYGSNVANVLWGITHAPPSVSVITGLVNPGPKIQAFMALAGIPVGNALRDLQIGSAAILGLGNTQIPSFAEVGVLSGGDLGTLGVIDTVLNWSGHPIVWTLPTDLLVSSTSQEGGLSPTNYNVRSSVVHTDERKFPPIAADVVSLLTGPLSKFAHSGFPAPVASFPFVMTHKAAPAPKTAHVVADPFVTITTPVAGSTAEGGSPLTITVAPTAGVTLQSVIIAAGTFNQSVGSLVVTQAPWTATFTIPDSFLGPCPISILAQDTLGDVCTTSTTINIDTFAFPSVLSCSPAVISMDNLGSQQQVTVTSVYTDSITRDLTSDPLTTWSSSNPAVATVDNSGLVTAVGNGNAVVTASRLGNDASSVFLVQFGQPSLTSVVPSAVAVGTTSVTLSGYDLGGTTAIHAYKAGVLDTGITVTGIVVDPTGTSLTCTMTVGAGAKTGLHILQVTAAGGVSALTAPADAAGLTVANATHAPTITPNGGTFSAAQSVTITDTQLTAAIYYTVDGSTPTQTSPLYTGAFMVSNSETVKAIAIGPGLAPSTVTSATFTIPVPTPSIAPNGGSFASPQSVTLTDSLGTALIYYTTDGSTPTSSSTLYTGPITVSSSVTLKAIGIADGFADSAVASASFTVAAPTPVITPNGGTTDISLPINITDSVDGAAIYYTEDGSTPSASSTLYTGPINIMRSETINAIAIAPGYANSAVASSTFTFVVTTYAAGVNMFSLPYTYTTTLSDLFGYASPVLAVWNPVPSTYAVTPTAPANQIVVGGAYWVRFPSAMTISQVGTPAPAGTPFVISLHTGWNMIGDPWIVSAPLSSCTFAGGTKTYAQAESSPGQLIGPSYGYSTSTHAYFVATSLDAYQGFWLYSFANTDISIPHPGP